MTRSQIRVLTKWFSAVIEAWAERRAPWAFDDNNHSVMTATWTDAYKLGGAEAAEQAVIALAQRHGIYLGKKRPV